MIYKHTIKIILTILLIAPSCGRSASFQSPQPALNTPLKFHIGLSFGKSISDQNYNPRYLTSGIFVSTPANKYSRLLVAYNRLILQPNSVGENDIYYKPEVDHNLVSVGIQRFLSNSFVSFFGEVKFSVRDNSDDNFSVILGLGSEINIYKNYYASIHYNYNGYNWNPVCGANYYAYQTLSIGVNIGILSSK